jgi:phenylacetate-CoA ligase
LASNPIYELTGFGLGLLRYHFFLRLSQKWSEAEIQKYQLGKLREVLIGAYKYSPYYKKTMDLHSFRPDQVRDIAQIRELPFLTKKLVRDNYSDIVSKKWCLSTDYRTSGSTGQPLEYKKSWSNIAWEYAFHFRYLGARQTGLGDRMAMLRTYVPKEGQPFWKKDPIFPALWLSAYHLNFENVGQYVEKIREFGATCLRGYPSSLYVLALFCKKKNIRNMRFKGIFSSSETLSDEQRSVIEEVFSTRVTEYYGISENVVSAYQIDETDYHVNPEYGLFEVVKPDGSAAGPGESGVIVGTGFNNQAFPFIRYWTGDVCKISTRPSPYEWPTAMIEKIVGREDDILVGTNGRPLPGVNFYSLFREITAVENFQIIQKAPAKFNVFVQPNEKYSSEVEIEIKRQLEARIGIGLEIEIIKTNDLRKNSIGKIRSIIREFPLEIT